MNKTCVNKKHTTSFFLLDIPSSFVLRLPILVGIDHIVNDGLVALVDIKMLEQGIQLLLSFNIQLTICFQRHFTELWRILNVSISPSKSDLIIFLQPNNSRVPQSLYFVATCNVLHLGIQITLEESVLLGMQGVYGSLEFA